MSHFQTVSRTGTVVGPTAAVEEAIYYSVVSRTDQLWSEQRPRFVTEPLSAVLVVQMFWKLANQLYGSLLDEISSLDMTNQFRFIAGNALHLRHFPNCRQEAHNIW